jgi:hypothetical protein
MIRSKGPTFALRLLVATVVVLAAGARQAVAQDQAVIDKLVQMNKKALDDYDTLEWESAKRTLLEALVAGKKAGLDNHPIVARTYIHLGAVYITGIRDRQKGLQSFMRAIEIDPSIRISKAMAAPELDEVFAEALKQARARGVAVAPAAAAAPPPPAPPPVVAPPPAPVPVAVPPPPPPPKRRAPVMEDASSPAPPKRRVPGAEHEPAARAPSGDEDSAEPDLPVHIGALDCPTPDDVPPDKSVKLRCAVAPNLTVARVFLMYREPGSEAFTATEMERTSKGWYQGKIPKKVVTGKSVQFYFEGRNGAGKPVVSNGRSDSPNLILIREKQAAEEAEAEAAEASHGAVDTEENPLDEREGGQGPRLYLGKVDKSKIGLDTRYGNRRWWIGLGVGSGYGYAKGDGLEVRQDLQADFAPGFGWAGLGHLAPEIGLQITPDIAVSIEGRNQWIPQPAKYAKFTARGAQSVLARILFFTKQQRLRFFFSMMAGGGEGFRFVLYPDADPKRSDFKDTVRGGPYLVGAGTGLYYEFSKPASLVLEYNALVGLPIFSVVGDLNLAIQFNIY